MDVASLDLTDYLMKILTQCGYSFITIVEWEIIHIQEKLFHVIMNLKQEMATVAASSFLGKSNEQPDGQVVTFDMEWICCPDSLFEINRLIYDTPTSTFLRGYGIL